MTTILLRRNALFVTHFLLAIYGLAGCSSVSTAPPRLESAPPSPTVLVAPTPAANLKPIDPICGEAAISRRCDVAPVGNVAIEAASRRRDIESWWRSGCGCPGGLASGLGQAIWCERNAGPCGAGLNQAAMLGQAFGVAKDGRMGELVEITDTRGKFKGLIRQGGSYASGEHIGTGNARGKFVGSFDELGNPLSGSLYAENRTFVADKFQDGYPVGMTLIVENSGAFATYECQVGGRCSAVKGDHHQEEIQKAVRFLVDFIVGKGVGVVEKDLQLRYAILGRQPYLLGLQLAAAAVKSVLSVKSL